MLTSLSLLPRKKNNHDRTNPIARTRSNQRRESRYSQSLDPAYYVGYSLEAVKKAVNSQLKCEFNEISLSDIPDTAFVHSTELDGNETADQVVSVIEQYLEKAFENQDNAYVVVPTKYIKE